MLESHLPKPTSHSNGFWENCRNGVLSAPRCKACAHLHFPPRPVCPNCLSSDVALEPSKGMGEVYSFTVIERPPSSDFEAPYVVALVRMDEGWKLGTRLVHCAPHAAHIGMRVSVRFQPVSEQITLPFFAPTATSTSG